MKVCCLQFDVAWEDRSRNEATIARRVDDARPAAGSLVLLPEMCLSGFSMDVARTASDNDMFFVELAKRHAIYLTAGLVRRADVAGGSRGLNQSVTFSPAGEVVCAYTKLHPFSFAGEDEHFAPGSEVVAFACGGFTVAPFVCYDLRFPEAFRAAIDQGATLLTVIANWPAARHEHWRTLLRARAIENQCYVAAVNRIGSDPHATYSGGSTIIDPRGDILAEAGDGECVIDAEIDADYVTTCRAKFPALRDRRINRV